jgi:hypothetical protein
MILIIVASVVAYLIGMGVMYRIGINEEGEDDTGFVFGVSLFWPVIAVICLVYGICWIPWQLGNKTAGIPGWIKHRAERKQTALEQAKTKREATITELERINDIGI